MRKLTLAVLAALLVSPVAMAGFSGDVIFAGGTFWNSTTNGAPFNDNDMMKGAMALAPVDLNTGIAGGAGDAQATDYEYLADEDPRWVGAWGTGNCMAWGRDVIMYDDDTALALMGSEYSTSSAGASVWLLQLEYRAGATLENVYDLGNLPAGGTAVENAKLPFFNAADPAIAGGVNSGKLRLALDGQGYRSPVDPRVFLAQGNNNVATYPYFQGAQSGVSAAYGLDRDEAGNVYVVGKQLDAGGLPSGVVVKVNTSSGVLADDGANRADQVLSIDSQIVSGAGGSAFTGVAYDQGKLFVADNGSNTIEVFDTAGAAVATLDTFVMANPAGGFMFITPEDVDVLASDQGSTRLIVNILPDTTLGGDAAMKLMVLDYDHNTNAFSLVNTLGDGSLDENGNASGFQVDYVGVAPDGSVFVNDFRGGANDSRHDFIAAEDLAAALTGDGSQQSVTVAINNAWGNTSPSYQRGLAFTPEPASLALLAMGGLALIRRRK